MKLEEVVVGKLVSKNLKIVTAESCTGGLVAATLVNVAGSSACFDEGYITYSNEAKIRLLGVSKESVRDFGVVSHQVVKEMAEGALKKAGADVAVSVSGIAGPSGGSEAKPVGTVFVGLSILSGEGCKTETFHFLFHGTREEVRRQTVEEVLRILRNAI